MTSIVEARRRLDKTLLSSALADTAILRNLVRKQLHKISEEKLATDEVVHTKSNELWKLLDTLRSAKGETTSTVVDGGWKVKQDTARFRVLYREGPESAPYHSICLDGIIDGPMSHAVVVGCEVPLYKEWWPQFAAPTFKITESRWLQRDTVGGDYSMLRFKVPWPLAMREVILSAFELEFFDEDLVAVLYKSAPDVTDEKVDGISYTQIPTLHSNTVRMDLDGGFVLQRIDHNCSFFRIVVDLDMKLDIVPPWLINFISRQLVGHGYKLYQKAVSGVKGSILEKLAESYPVYKRIQDLDDTSLYMCERTLPEKDTAIKKGSYNVEHVSLESAFKSSSDQELLKTLKESSENVQLQGKQYTDTPLDESLLHLNNPSDYHESSPDCFVPVEETNNTEVATASVEQEKLLNDGDKPTDPEVIWALDILKKLTAHFNNKKAAAQTSESEEQSGTVDNNWTAMVDSILTLNEHPDAQEGPLLQNVISRGDNGEVGCSRLTPVSIKVTAAAGNSKENRSNHFLTTGDLIVKRVGSEATSFSEDSYINPARRGSRSLVFRKWQKV